jgi:hypothetical protein
MQGNDGEIQMGAVLGFHCTSKKLENTLTKSMTPILHVDSKRSDDGVQHSELLGFRTLSIVWYSKN